MADTSAEMPLHQGMQRGSKQEELEASVMLDSYDLAVTPETWWDRSHDCSMTNNGHRLFRRDMGGKRQRDCPVQQQLDRV